MNEEFKLIADRHTNIKYILIDNSIHANYKLAPKIKLMRLITLDIMIMVYSHFTSYTFYLQLSLRQLLRDTQITIYIIRMIEKPVQMNR